MSGINSRVGLRLIFDLGSFSSANKSLSSQKQSEVVVVCFFSCYPSLRASSVQFVIILVRSGGFLLTDTELRGSKTEAKSLNKSYLALNMFKLTLKRYNMIHPTAFENLLIQTSILGSVSAKHPSKHWSFRSYTRANENTEIYFGTQLLWRKA